MQTEPLKEPVHKTAVPAPIREGPRLRRRTDFYSVFLNAVGVIPSYLLNNLQK